MRFAPACRRGGNSEAGRRLRFRFDYLRLPVLLVLAALALDKLIHYVALPAGGYAAGETDYLVAEIDLARGHDPAALKSIRAALLYTRSDPAFWRLAAEISERLRSPESTYCWQQLDRLSPGSFATQMNLAESALRYRQLDAATTVLREVAPPNQSRIAFACAAGELAEACGETETARGFFSRVESARPRDPDLLLALAQWHAQSRAPAELAAARADLLALLSFPDMATKARRLLIVIELRMENRAEAKRWSDDLLRSGAASFDDRVQRLNILQGPAFDAARGDLLATNDPASVATLADWLVSHGRPQEALAWIRRQAPTTQSDAQVGRACAECLSGLGQWSELRLDQATESWPGHEAERHMYLARADAELGFEPEARAAWSQAVLACRDYPDYLALLDYLNRNKLAASASSFWVAARIEVWSEMAVRYPDQAWIIRSLLRDAVARRDSLRVQDCWQQLAAIDPADLEAAANGARICVLRGTQMEKSAALLERLHTENPANTAVATARAYDLYRQGRFADALELMGGLNAEELQAPDRAVYLGALLAAAGPIPQARLYLQAALSRPELLEEERALAQRAARLISYREGMASLLHPSVRAPPSPNLQTLTSAPNDDCAIFQVVRSVAFSRSNRLRDAALALAGIDPGTLDSAGLSIYLGGMLDLAGQHEAAVPYLELSADLPFESAREKNHRALELWWSLPGQSPDDPALLAGLLAAYHGLNSCENDASFWRRDEPRELRLLRRAVAQKREIGAVQARLRELLQRVPATPEVSALDDYTLLLQGQPQAARARMEELAPADLARPETSLYYGLALAACGDREAARPYLRQAEKSSLLPEEIGLARQAEKAP